MQGTTTRRRALIGAGALFGTGGVLFVASDSSSATATIQDGTFDVPDEYHDLETGSVSDVVVTADLAYSWSANTDITRQEITLAAGFSEDSADILTTHEETDLDTQSREDTLTLEASLLDGADYDADLFVPREGGSKGVKATFIVELLLFRGEELLETATMTEKAEINVSDKQIEVTTEFGGTGEVTVNEG